MTEKKDERYDYVVYKLCSDFCDDYYVGSTRNMVQRKKNHKGSCNNQNHLGYNTKKSKTIRDNGGWENWRMVPLELMKNSTKFDAECREEQLRVQLNAILNSQRATRGNISVQEYNKQHRQEKKDHYKEYDKKYYEENREEIRARDAQKFECNCGSKINHGDKARHFKSKKHQKYLDSLELSP
jgi:hypothetical protein